MIKNAKLDRAVAKYNAGFINVIYNLQMAGIDLHAGQAPEALGITTREFNRRSLAMVKGLWDRDIAPVKLPEGLSEIRDPAFKYLATLTNIEESLRMIAQKPELTNRDFKALGLTKNDFVAKCRDAVTAVLAIFPEYAKASQSGGEVLVAPMEGCMTLAGIDPKDDAVFQAAGFESRAGFDSKVAEWKAAAEANSQHGCCGGGSHNHAPAPAPGT